MELLDWPYQYNVGRQNTIIGQKLGTTQSPASVKHGLRGNRMAYANK